MNNRTPNSINPNIKEMPIQSGYVGKAELATEEDAILLGLRPEDAPFLYICDRFEHFAMFYFRDHTEIGVESPASSIRGWIVDTHSNRVVCPSYVEKSISYIDPKLLSVADFGDLDIRMYVEGINIRLFWSGSKWIHAAQRKIDCTNSKIPGCDETYLEMFNEASPNFDYEQLDKNLVYVMIVQNFKSQIMNPTEIPSPMLYHVATISIDQNSKLSVAVGQPRLTGVHYIPQLSIENAIISMTLGSFVMIYDGFDLMKLGDIRMEKLVEIRGTAGNTHVPVELMYMRLPPDDRPLLVDAVPFHLKSQACSEKMEPYIDENSRKLASYCAGLATFDSRTTCPPKLTKCLLKLFSYLKFPKKRVNMQRLSEIYLAIIQDLTASRGDFIYACFKEMEKNLARAQRTISAPKSKIVSVEVVYTVEGEDYLVEEPSQATIKGNVSIKYVKDAKKYRTRRTKPSSSNSANEAVDLISLITKAH